MRRTFDSSATPKSGHSLRARGRATKPDLEQFQKRMAATIEQARANDPKELKKQLTAAEAALRQALAQAAPPAKIRTVEKPVLSDADLKRIASAMSICGKALDRVHAILESGPV